MHSTPCSPEQLERRLFIQLPAYQHDLNTDCPFNSCSPEQLEHRLFTRQLLHRDHSGKLLTEKLGHSEPHTDSLHGHPRHMTMTVKASTFRNTENLAGSTTGNGCSGICSMKDHPGKLYSLHVLCTPKRGHCRHSMSTPQTFNSLPSAVH